MIVPSLETYLPNVALHAILISATALAVAAFFRTPTIRAASAAVGVLAVTLVPWISAVPASSGDLVEPLILAPVPAEMAPDRVPAADPINLTDATMTVVEAPRMPERPKWRDVLLAAGMVWAAGVLVAALLGARGAVRVWRWKRTLRTPEKDELELVRRALPESPVLGRVRVGDNPCVAGFFRPVLVLPESLLVAGRERKLAWAARHELSHLEARDLQWLALLRVAQAVFWWNPVVHRLAGVWSEAREQVCDRAAVEDASQAPGYAEFLLGFARDRKRAVGIAMADRRPVARLKLRLRSVVEFGDDPPVARTFGFSAALAFILAGVGCSHLGMRADQAPAEAAPAVPSAQGASVRQVVVTSRLLAGDSPFARDGQVLGEDEMALLMRKAAQTKGNTLITAPSFTARGGQPATLEMLRTHPDDPVTTGPMAGIRQLDNPKRRYVGLVMYSRAVIRGDAVNLHREFAFALPPGRGWDGVAEGAERNPPPVDWERVRKFRASSKARLKSGQWVTTHLGRDDQGRYGTVFTQVEIVEVPRPVPPVPTRWPFPVTGYVLEAADPEEREWIFQEGGVAAAVIGTANDGSWPIVAQLTVPQTELLVKKWPGKVRKFGTVGLTPGHPARPWWRIGDVRLRVDPLTASGEQGPRVQVEHAGQSFGIPLLEDRMAAVELPVSAGSPRKFLLLAGESGGK